MLRHSGLWCIFDRHSPIHNSFAGGRSFLRHANVIPAVTMSMATTTAVYFTMSQWSPSRSWQHYGHFKQPGHHTKRLALRQDFIRLLTISTSIEPDTSLRAHRHRALLNHKFLSYLGFALRGYSHPNAVASQPPL